MGCSTCKSECGREDGCGSRKAAQKEVLDDLLSRLYPSRTWGQPDDEACFRAGPTRDEALRLAGALSAACQAKTAYRDGGEDDLCGYIYVLCLGREPALVDVREHGLALLASAHELSPAPEPSSAQELSPAPALSTAGPLQLQERYLRVCLSRLGRLAAVQEVALELDLACGQAPEGMAVIREIPQPGVFDPKLLRRFQKTVDLLQAHGLQHLDMGLLDVPAAGFGLEAGEYADRYGVPPALFNFLFYPQPVTTAAASYL